VGSLVLPLIDAFAPGKRQEFRKMGDINMDGVIDQMDANLIQAAWLVTSADPRWNTPIPDTADNPLGITILYSDCDLNGSGAVNEKDVTILTLNWQKNIWSWLGWPPQSTVEWICIGAGVLGVAVAGGVGVYAVFYMPK
jgi:hypothetical protein